MTEKKRDWLVHWVLTVIGYIGFGVVTAIAGSLGYGGLVGLGIGLIVLHTVFMFASINMLRYYHG